MRNLRSSETHYAFVGQISRLRFASLEMTGEELDYAAGQRLHIRFFCIQAAKRQPGS
jgi:hypothetical protein